MANLAGPSVVGQYSLAVALVIPVQMLFNLQLRALQASDARRQYQFSTYFTLRLITTGLVCLVVLFIAAGSPLAEEIRLVVIGVLAIKAMESLSDVLYGAFQQAERMDFSSKARIIESVAGISVFVLIFYSSQNLLIALLAIAAALLAVLLFFTIPGLRSLHGGLEFRLFGSEMGGYRALLWMGTPLGIAMGLGSLNSGLPRLALGAFRSDFEVGIYAGYAQLVVAGTIVVGALGQAITPTLARLYTEEDRRGFYSIVNRLVFGALVVGVIAAILAYFIGSPVVTVLYSHEYAGFNTALVILAVSAGFTFASSIQGYALTSARVITSQVWMVLAVILVTGTALLIFVQNHGVIGASLSVLLGSITQFSVSGWLLRTRVERSQESIDA